MRVVITAAGREWDSQVDQRFGRAACFFCFNDEDGTIQIIDNQSAAGEAHGAGTKAAAIVAEYEPQVLITGNGPGQNAESVLSRTGVEVYIGAGGMTVKEAYDAWCGGKLSRA
ncbi:MAG: dinitrogenase iron-molybdenum cofactor biosynthesis protein [Spirochaetia bacterium]|nr:dinitrogenase iron-molybdenum cofactor biosynthesis protein [Spirochaetia bacterium]